MNNQTNIKELSVKIKTIEIDGKKITKQFLKQIELEKYYFVDSKNNSYNLHYIFDLSINEVSNYSIDINVLGWFNIILDDNLYISKWLQSHVLLKESLLCTILFINKKNELKRGYMYKPHLKSESLKNIPQLFI